MSPVMGEIFVFCSPVSVLVVGPTKTPVHEVMDTGVIFRK